MLLSILKVSKEYSKNSRSRLLAIKDVSFRIEKGEFLSIVGPSGCGKTTTLRIISGFETPSAGEVWISGKMVNNMVKEN